MKRNFNMFNFKLLLVIIFSGTTVLADGLTNLYVGVPCSPGKLLMTKDGKFGCYSCNPGQYWNRRSKACSVCTSQYFTNLHRNIRRSCKDPIKPKKISTTTQTPTETSTQSGTIISKYTTSTDNIATSGHTPPTPRNMIHISSPTTKTDENKMESSTVSTADKGSNPEQKKDKKPSVNLTAFYLTIPISFIVFLLIGLTILYCVKRFR